MFSSVTAATEYIDIRVNSTDCMSISCLAHFLLLFKTRLGSSYFESVAGFDGITGFKTTADEDFSVKNFNCRRITIAPFDPKFLLRTVLDKQLCYVPTFEPE